MWVIMIRENPDTENNQISFFWQIIGDKLSNIGGKLDYPRLTKELAGEIGTLWKDAAIQVAQYLNMFGSHALHSCLLY